MLRHHRRQFLLQSCRQQHRHILSRSSSLSIHFSFPLSTPPSVIISPVHHSALLYFSDVTTTTTSSFDDHQEENNNDQKERLNQHFLTKLQELSLPSSSSSSSSKWVNLGQLIYSPARHSNSSSSSQQQHQQQYEREKYLKMILSKMSYIEYEEYQNQIEAIKKLFETYNKEALISEKLKQMKEMNNSSSNNDENFDEDDNDDLLREAAEEEIDENSFRFVKPIQIIKRRKHEVPFVAVEEEWFEARWNGETVTNNNKSRHEDVDRGGASNKNNNKKSSLTKSLRDHNLQNLSILIERELVKGAAVVLGSSSSSKKIMPIVSVELSLLRENLTPQLRLYIRTKFGGSLIKAVEFLLSEKKKLQQQQISHDENSSTIEWTLERSPNHNDDDDELLVDSHMIVVKGSEQIHKLMNENRKNSNNNNRSDSSQYEIFDAVPSLSSSSSSLSRNLHHQAHQETTTTISDHENKKDTTTSMLPTGTGNWLENVFRRDAALLLREKQQKQQLKQSFYDQHHHAENANNDDASSLLKAAVSPANQKFFFDGKHRRKVPVATKHINTNNSDQNYYDHDDHYQLHEAQARYSQRERDQRRRQHEEEQYLKERAAGNALTIEGLTPYIPSFFIPLSLAVDGMRHLGYTEEHLLNFFAGHRIITRTASGSESGSHPRVEIGKGGGNVSRYVDGTLQIVTLPTRLQSNNNNNTNHNGTSSSSFIRIHGGVRTQFDMSVIASRTNEQFREYEPNPVFAQPFIDILYEHHTNFEEQQQQQQQLQRNNNNSNNKSIVRHDWLTLEELLQRAGKEAEDNLTPWKGQESLLYFAQLQHIFAFTPPATNTNPHHGGLIRLRPSFYRREKLHRQAINKEDGILVQRRQVQVNAEQQQQQEVENLMAKQSPTPLFFNELASLLSGKVLKVPTMFSSSSRKQQQQHQNNNKEEKLFKSLFTKEALRQLRLHLDSDVERFARLHAGVFILIEGEEAVLFYGAMRQMRKLNEKILCMSDDEDEFDIDNIESPLHQKKTNSTNLKFIALRQGYERLKVNLTMTTEDQLNYAIQRHHHPNQIRALRRKLALERKPNSPFRNKRTLARAIHDEILPRPTPPQRPFVFLLYYQLKDALSEEMKAFLPPREELVGLARSAPDLIFCFNFLNHPKIPLGDICFARTDVLLPPGEILLLSPTSNLDRVVVVDDDNNDQQHHYNDTTSMEQDIDYDDDKGERCQQQQQQNNHQQEIIFNRIHQIQQQQDLTQFSQEVLLSDDDVAKMIAQVMVMKSRGGRRSSTAQLLDGSSSNIRIAAKPLQRSLPVAIALERFRTVHRMLDFLAAKYPGNFLVIKSGDVDVSDVQLLKFPGL